MGRLHSRIACATPGSTCGRTPGDEELAEFSHPGRTRTSGVRHQPEQAQAGGESLRLAERQCGTVANEISRTAAGAMDVSIGDRCLQFAPSCVLSASAVVGGHSVFARSKSEPAETKKHHYARYFAQRNTRHRESRKNHGIFPQPVNACPSLEIYSNDEKCLTYSGILTVAFAPLTLPQVQAGNLSKYWTAFRKANTTR